MPYDGKLLASAREQLEQIRAANLREQRRRTDEIYRKIPEIRGIDQRMRAQMTELLKVTFSGTGDVRSSVEALHAENTDLKVRKSELLVGHGYPIDYLDDLYSCPKCKDTGVYQSGVCSCLKRLYNKELSRELSSLMLRGDESFEKFNLSLYASSYDPSCSCVPREVMSAVFESCRKFADSFPNVLSPNLLFQGGTGLGKTYLSACIARAVAEKGYSVCYFPATTALEAFEQQKFSRDPEAAEAASKRVRRMLECDLMILDDLGTEMTTQVSISALYTLINTRLSAKKPTIISTNLLAGDLQKRYTPQICSRIEGEYLRLPFVGKDIRTMKK